MVDKSKSKGEPRDTYQRYSSNRTGGMIDQAERPSPSDFNRHSRLLSDEEKYPILHGLNPGQEPELEIDIGNIFDKLDIEIKKEQLLNSSGIPKGIKEAANEMSFVIQIKQNDGTFKDTFLLSLDKDKGLDGIDLS